MNTFTLPAYVGIILKAENKILLVQRHNTDWMPGYWNFPGGLLEKHETLLRAAIRETKEEVDVEVKPVSLELVHVIHVHVNTSNTKDILGFYFMADSWQGTPFNNEPDHHSQIAWFAIDKLPPNITDHALLAIEGLKKGKNYSEHGWAL
jgi:8-oxo-dGTP diphosphatase